MGGFGADAFGLQELGGGLGDTVQEGRLVCLGFEFFPVAQDGFYFRRGGLGVLEDVGVLADKFLGEGAAYFMEVKEVFFGSELGLEDNLQEEVSQLCLKAAPVIAMGSGFHFGEDFVTFFEESGA